MSTTITSNRDAEECVARVEHLIGAGAAEDAVALADSLDGHPLLVKQIQAIAFTGAAPILGRRDLVTRALELWREFDPDHDTSAAYNLGNAEVGAWELVRTHDGFVQALENADAHTGRVARCTGALLRTTMPRYGSDSKH